MLPLLVVAGAGADSDPEGTVIMPVFIVAVAVAMVGSLYLCQTGMFRMSS